MIIFVMRHAKAESENPLEKGRQGDTKIGLLPEGWLESIRAGQFFAPYLVEQGITTWPRFRCSPHKRPQQSLSGLFYGMGDLAPAGEPEIFEEANLAEQSFGVLPHLQLLKEHPDLQNIPPETLEQFVQIMTVLSKDLYQQEPYLGGTWLGEPGFSLMGRFNDLVDTLSRDERDGADIHFLATHGAVIKNMLLRLNHIPVSKWRDIPTPNNTDIFRIDLEPGTMRVKSCLRIYNGKTGLAENSNIVEHLRPKGFQDLPPVPDEFKIR